MADITRVPSVLVHQDSGKPAMEKDILTTTGGDVQLLGISPDAEGLITVQAAPYRVRPEDAGLRLKPASVVMALTEAEAAPIIDYFQRQAAAAQGLPAPDFPGLPPENPPDLVPGLR